MRKLTVKQRDFVKDFRDLGGDLTRLQAERGYNVQKIFRFLHNPEVKKEIVNNVTYCRERLNEALPSVLGNLLELQQNDNVPYSVRANIGLQLLDRGGLSTPKEPSIQVNINTSISDRARELVAKRLNEIENAEYIDVEPIPSDTQTHNNKEDKG